MLTNSFFLKYLCWILAATTLFLKSGKNSAYICVFFLCILFTLQDDFGDLFHYKAAFNHGIYVSEIGFELLQGAIKLIPLPSNYLFQFIKLTPVLIFFLTPRKYGRMLLPIIVSQFMFLSVFIGLRQGIAASIILVGILWVYENKILGFLLLALAGFFHESAFFVAALFYIIYFLRISRLNFIIISIFLIFFLLFLSHILPDILGKYQDYIRSSVFDFRVSRFNPYFKLIISISYFILTFKYSDYKDNSILSTIAKNRFLFFLLSISFLIFFDSSELASRIFLYFLAFDTLFFSYLIANNIKQYRIGFYFLSIVIAPNVITFLKINN